MSLIVLYFLYYTSVLSFYIVVVLTLSIRTWTERVTHGIDVWRSCLIVFYGWEPKHYNECYYSSMLRLKLFHDSKWCLRAVLHHSMQRWLLQAQWNFENWTLALKLNNVKFYQSATQLWGTTSIICAKSCRKSKMLLKTWHSALNITHHSLSLMTSMKPNHA